MRVAEVIAERSKCTRRKIGAVIVTRDNRPVATGYNGPPANFDTLTSGSSCDKWCPRAMNNSGTQSYDNCVSVHAETNALLFADRRDYEGGSLYVTSVPCWDCAKIVANSGISAVFTKIDWERDSHRKPSRTLQFLDQCGVEVILL